MVKGPGSLETALRVSFFFFFGGGGVLKVSGAYKGLGF